MAATSLNRDFCLIPLHREVIDNHSSERKWEEVGVTLVDSWQFRRLTKYTWEKRWCPQAGDYHVARTERIDGQDVTILMSREVLMMSRGAGHEQEIVHLNQDLLDNTVVNLRDIPLPAVLGALVSRYEGVRRSGSGFVGCVTYDGRLIHLPVQGCEIEAALTYFYATKLLFENYHDCGEFPPDEMPTEARLDELWQLVIQHLTGLGLLIPRVEPTEEVVESIGGQVDPWSGRPIKRDKNGLPCTPTVVFDDDKSSPAFDTLQRFKQRHNLDYFEGIRMVIFDEKCGGGRRIIRKRVFQD